MQRLSVFGVVSCTHRHLTGKFTLNFKPLKIVTFHSKQKTNYTSDKEIQIIYNHAKRDKYSLVSYDSYNNYSKSLIKPIKT